MLHSKGNGWFEFVMSNSFEILAQFSKWSSSFVSDGNRIQVPSIFCGSVTTSFILIDLCSPGLKAILSGKYNVKTLFSKCFGLLIFLSTKKW